MERKKVNKNKDKKKPEGLNFGKVSKKRKCCTMGV